MYFSELLGHGDHGHECYNHGFSKTKGAFSLHGCGCVACGHGNGGYYCGRDSVAMAVVVVTTKMVGVALTIAMLSVVKLTISFVFHTSSFLSLARTSCLEI